jgi:glycerate 2-kinase
MKELRDAARAIFAETLARVNVRDCVRDAVLCDGDSLGMAGASVPLTELNEVRIVAIGKAGMAMYQGAEDALSRVPGLRVQAIVTAPSAVNGSVRGEFIAGSHPYPDGSSMRAAEAVLEMLRDAGPRTGVLFLISGGASAMVEQPPSRAISMEDVGQFYRALVGSGLRIAEMNALRKYVSAVKGGRLAQAAAAARVQWTLLVSDVPAGQPGVIASGPSLPDDSTVAECDELFARLRAQQAELPKSIVDYFECGEVAETPKRDDVAFARSHWDVLLSSEQLAEEAATAARRMGFAATIDNTCDEWEYREAATYLLQKLEALKAGSSMSQCLISAGEVSVTLPQHPGDGGRNQHFALWCAGELHRRGMSGTVLSAGTDGVDGVSAAAGAIADETTMERAATMEISLERNLAAFDSAPLFDAIGDQLVTGPTGNNLRDLRLLLG